MYERNINKILLSGLLAALAVVVFIVLYFGRLSEKGLLLGREIIEYKLEGKIYRFYTARNQTEWVQGLMHVHHLNDVDGMIFYFPDLKRRHFWNKNTYINLDVYWLRNDKILGKGFLPKIDGSGRLTTISSPAPCNIVIEKYTYQ